MKDSRRLVRALYEVIHFLLIVPSLVIAFQLRFEFSVPHQVAPLFAKALFLVILVKAPVFHWAGLHKSLRIFAGVPDLLRLVASNVVASVLFSLAGYWRSSCRAWLRWMVPPTLTTCLGGTRIRARVRGFRRTPRYSLPSLSPLRARSR